MLISLQELRRIYAKLESDARLLQFYSKFPRNVFWNADNKAASIGILRDASDLPDMIRRMQRALTFLGSILVNTPSDVKQLAIEWLTTRYSAIGIDIRSMPAEIEESSFSDPAICVDWFGRRLSIDFLRTVSVGCGIRRYIQKEQLPFRLVEVGAGLGHLARTLRLMGISRSHIIIDLPESLVFSYAFLLSNFPDASSSFVSSLDEAREIRVEDYDFVFIPSGCADQIDFSGAELFLNTASLGEMRNEAIRYCDGFPSAEDQSQIPIHTKSIPQYDQAGAARLALGKE
jgi:putative sugar O-methyltransferase